MAKKVKITKRMGDKMFKMWKNGISLHQQATIMKMSPSTITRYLQNRRNGMKGLHCDEDMRSSDV